LNDITRRIASWAAWTTRHALAAIPYSIAFEQLFYLLIVAPLHHDYNLARVIVVELRCGTHCSAYATIHARLKPLYEAYILGEHIVIFSHIFLDFRHGQRYIF
jgi:hypothetical protein